MMPRNTLSYLFTRYVRNILKENNNSFALYTPCTLRSYSSKVSNTSTSTEKRLTTDEIVASLNVRKRSQKYSYVFKKPVAKKLVGSILRNRVNKKAPILEIAPGPGLVSKELLNHGVEKVISLEDGKEFHPYLQSIKHGYNGRFEFHAWDMLNINEKFPVHQSNEDGLSSYKKKEAEILNSLSESAYAETETPYSIFTIGGGGENHDFIFYISRNIPNEDPILLNERIEFFFLVHPKFKYSIEQMLPTDKPSKYTRFFNHFHTFNSLLYDITFHDQFDANDFVPSFSKKTLSKQIDASKRHLVKMQLKANISSILPLEHHYAFSIFLRHIFRKRKIRIIPAMEMLVAGCGLHMLVDGFTMMETIENVSPQRLLQLYKRMLLWPEYSFSNLKNYIVSKTHGDPLEDDDI